MARMRAASASVLMMRRLKIIPTCTGGSEALMEGSGCDDDYCSQMGDSDQAD